MVLILSLLVLAEDHANISPVSSQIKRQMIKGNSYKHGCPISFKNLRYLQIRHLNFNGKTVIGKMIVHKNVANDVVDIFKELYAIDYPIRKMKLISHYKGLDWQSIEADNTSAFNCRNVIGSKKWSKHSYGKAIDINPIENPYVFRSGKSSHKASKRYTNRVHKNTSYADKALLLKQDKATKIFKKYGWNWGGDWTGVKDYQHFYK